MCTWGRSGVAVRNRSSSDPRDDSHHRSLATYIRLTFPPRPTAVFRTAGSNSDMDVQPLKPVIRDQKVDTNSTTPASLLRSTTEPRKTATNSTMPPREPNPSKHHPHHLTAVHVHTHLHGPRLSLPVRKVHARLPPIPVAAPTTALLPPVPAYPHLLPTGFRRCRCLWL